MRKKPTTNITTARPSRRDKPATLDDMTGDGKIRLNCDVPKSLYTELKVHAAVTSQSITAIVIEAIRTQLKNYSIE